MEEMLPPGSDIRLDHQVSCRTQSSEDGTSRSSGLMLDVNAPRCGSVLVRPSRSLPDPAELPSGERSGALAAQVRQESPSASVRFHLVTWRSVLPLLGRRILCNLSGSGPYRSWCAEGCAREACTENRLGP